MEYREQLKSHDKFPRRKALRLALAAFTALAASLDAPLARAADYYRFAPLPAWVTPLEPHYEETPPPGLAAASAWIQLFDRQIEIGATGDDFYQHVAVKVLNAVGVDEYSQFDFIVDPSYQALEFHSLRVVRAGAVIDQRRLARISELPQEPELRSRIYKGRYNINIVLSDVRAGDVVEYAYTVRSRERFFPGRSFARLDTGWSVPVRRQRIRVRAPLARDLAFRSSDGRPLPAPITAGDKLELAIEWQDLAPLPALTSTPGWHSLWPYLEVADRGSWADVARAVEPLFRLPAKTGPGVAAALDAIRGSGGTPADHALRALQYVQEEIRYTSIAVGRGSYEPALPDLVMERRFGDCKDKSLLLATLLDRLGVEAQVALVNTARGRALDGLLPTPYAFDHAIVRAVIDGEVHWLDPTAATQYAPLVSAHHPDFERALPVGPASAGLEPIPPPAPDMRRRETATTLDLSAGLKAAGTLEVTTRYEGAHADEMRPALSSRSAEQRQADYESYTAHYYPGARSLAPVEVLDDRSGNTITVRESYRLESTFTPDDEGVLGLTIHADELYTYAEALGAGGRQAPLALEYPIRVKQRVVAKLPEDWRVKAEEVAVDNPAFRYRSKVDYADRTLTLDYEYEALASSVPPEDIAKYETDRARVCADLGYSLTRDDPATKGGGHNGVAPLPMLVMIFTLVLSIGAAVRWGYRYDPPAGEAAPGAPAGIRGWLLLPAFSSIAMPFLSGAAVISWWPWIGAEPWHTLPTVVNEAYAGTTHLAVLSIMAVSVLQTVLAALMAVLFFTKRTSAPRCYIVFIWFVVLTDNAAAIWNLAAGFNKDATDAANAIRGALAAIVWTLYMRTSKRVKATFVRRL